MEEGPGCVGYGRLRHPLRSFAVLNGRLYRACFAPLLVALVVAGFSLDAPGGTYSSTLAPDAFNGAGAYAELQSLAARFPERRPGSRGDQELAGEIAHTLQGLGASAAGGFSVSVHRETLQTVYGRRTLSTVIARRPGLTGASPIVLLAHRDAAGRGAQAELSGTAVLLQLARVLAGSETRRTVVIVSTSGGSDGAGGAAGFAADQGELTDVGGAANTALTEPIDAAIVLGNVAGMSARKPFVVPYSSGLGLAPPALTNTLSAAISQQIGTNAGAPNTLGQLARFALPLRSGEQGPLLAHGIAAAMLQVSGERPPSSSEPVSAQRLENFGRAALSAVYALDTAPDLETALQTGLPIRHKVLPAWAVRLLVFALLLPPLFVLIDGLARLLRRRRTNGGPAAQSASLWAPRSALLWALACALPFLAVALFMRLLGLLGVLGAPAGLVPAIALPGGTLAIETALAPPLALALAWLAWPALMRRMGLPAFGLRRAELSAAAGLAPALLLLGLALLVCVFNPYAALLLVPALHLWLAVIDPRWRSAGASLHRVRALALVVLGLLPAALLLAVDAHQLGYGLASLAHAGALLLAGGFFGIPAMLVWCLALGCLAAVVLVALSPPVPLFSEAPQALAEPMPITVRGPMSYAGPGSLGGTESALRR
jgi:hypothetical protein